MYYTDKRSTSNGTNSLTFPIGKFVYHIVFSNFIVALSAGLLSFGFAKFQAIPNALLYGVFNFGVTYSVYNGQRLIKSGQTVRTPWLDWVKKHEKRLYALAFGALLLAAYALLAIGHLHWKALALLALTTVVSLLYVIRIKGKRNLREIPYLKIHLIALSWTFALIGFPHMNEGLPLEPSFFVLLLAHYAYVLACTIPFDMRDLKFDDRNQRTLPQVVGVQISKVIALLLLVVSYALIISLFPQLLASPWFALAFSVQIGLVLFSGEHRGDLYCAGLIDGAIALLGLSYWLSA